MAVKKGLVRPEHPIAQICSPADGEHIRQTHKDKINIMLSKSLVLFGMPLL